MLGSGRGGLVPHTTKYLDAASLVGLTWGVSLAMGAGPFGADGDAGEAEDGPQEVEQKSYDGWTLNPGSDSHGHTGCGCHVQRPPPAPSYLGLDS